MFISIEITVGKEDILPDSKGALEVCEFGGMSPTAREPVFRGERKQA